MTLQRRLRALTVAALVTVSLPRVARACGEWVLEDEERDQIVRFLLVTIEALPRPAAATAHYKTVGWFKHKEPKLCQRGGTKLDLKDGQFLAGRTVRARLEGKTLELDKRRFEISIEPILDKAGYQRFEEGRPNWTVKVTSDGASIAQGDAMSFHGCSQEDRTAQQEEIRERVACYLVLRGKGRPLPASPSPGGRKGAH